MMQFRERKDGGNSSDSEDEGKNDHDQKDKNKKEADGDESDTKKRKVDGKNVWSDVLGEEILTKELSRDVSLEVD